MSLDEQLRALCEEHDLASLSITYLRAPHRMWPSINVQWLDDRIGDGRDISSASRDTVVESIQTALEGMLAKRRPEVAVPDLEAAA